MMELQHQRLMALAGQLQLESEPPRESWRLNFLRKR